MAILFSAASQRLSRTTGTFLSTASDFTVMFWGKFVTDTPAAGRFRTFFQISNGAVTKFLFLGSDLGVNTLILSVGNNIDPSQQVNGPVLTLGTYYHVTATYTAATKVLELFVNAISVGTITLDLSTATFTQQEMGDEGTPSWPNTVVEYYRDWQRKLTAAQIAAERTAFTAALATNLFTDTPLVVTGTLTDLSGNAHTWTAVGAIAFTSPGPLPPANISAATAIDMTGLLPYAPAALNVQDASVTGGVWYKYTATSSDTVIGFWALGVLGGYAPRTEVTLASLVDIVSTGTTGNIPVQFYVASGLTNYVKITSAGNVAPAMLTVNVLKAPNATVAIGSIVDPDDTAGFPFAVLSPTSGLPIRFVLNMPANESGAVLTTGLSAIPDGIAGNNLNIYNSNYTLLATAGTPVGAVPIQAITANMSDGWYVTGVGVATLARVNTSGVVVQTWTLPNTSRIVIGVTQTNTIFYHATQTANVPINRWDLVGSVAMTDLIAGQGAGIGLARDMLVLSDGTIVVVYLGPGLAATLTQISAAGAILKSYDLGVLSVPADTRLAMAIEDPTMVYVWLKQADSKSVFQKMRLSDGVVIATTAAAHQFEIGVFGGAAVAAPERFGHSESCPFWITRTASVPSVCVSIASAAADPAGAPIGGNGPYGESVSAFLGCHVVTAGTSDPAGGPIGGTSPYGIF